VAPAGYLALATALCRRHGALLIVDESHTSLGRAGRLLACEAEGIEPDVVVLGEGLGGGLCTVGAALVRRSLWQRAGAAATSEHGPPISSIPAAVALATVELVQRDRLVAQAQAAGTALGIGLRLAAASSPLVHNVVGRGLLWGVELAAPIGLRALTLGAIDRLTGALVPERVIAGLREHGFLVDSDDNAPEVLRIAPPLVVDKEDATRFGAALADVLARRASGVASAVAGAALARLAGERDPEK
jgi:putrescine aminotransferase